MYVSMYMYMYMYIPVTVVITVREVRGSKATPSGLTATANLARTQRMQTQPRE